MKVLWVTHTLFPDFSDFIGRPIPTAGGWMYGLSKDLVGSGVELVVATAMPGVGENCTSINNITYYSLKCNKPRTEYDSLLEAQWKTIIAKEKPDIVHLHGTEYGPGLALIRSCPELVYVASIQGMISVYARYYTGGIPRIEIQKHRTFRDFIKNNSILQAQRKFERRGKEIEVNYIKEVRAIIGRTQWDHDHVKTINPDCRYHFCNESLRDSFYESKTWNLDSKSEYTIFLSQAGYPIKGIHKVIEAIYLIKNRFPKIQIRVAGNNICNRDTIKNKLRLGGYGSYIGHLLKRYGLEGHITFTGPLSAEGMVKEYLNCHIFICPSSIENSPNSLGEAQLLGVPCIASYVGGVPDMVEHNETGLLYRYEEVEMLAQAIKRIFLDDKLAKQLSKNGKLAASKRHDRHTNVNQLVKIYNSLQKDGAKEIL